jgi:hypothetical protein
MNGKQFYKEDYKTRDYGTLMHEYEKKLDYNEKMQRKKLKDKAWADKKRVRTWTEADQLFEDQLWAS